MRCYECRRSLRARRSYRLPGVHGKVLHGTLTKSGFGAMQEFGFFLGRFHVLALHLPIGIVIAAVVLDWLARRPRYAPLAGAAPLLWALTAASAVLAAVLGWLHFGEGAFTGPSAEAHRFWGIVTAAVAVGGWWLAARSAGRAGSASVMRLAMGIAMLALVSITGHYGGHLTHGTTFLTEYAPEFLSD